MRPPLESIAISVQMDTERNLKGEEKIVLYLLYRDYFIIQSMLLGLPIKK